MMAKLSKQNEKVIYSFLRDFILSFKNALKHNFESEIMENLNIEVKSIHFLSDIAGLDSINYFITRRLYRAKDTRVEMFILYPEPLMATLSDIALGGSGEVSFQGSITELQINSCLDSFNDCYKSIKLLFHENYKEKLDELEIESIYQGTPRYQTAFMESDFVVIYSAQFSKNTILNIPVLFKYNELESLLQKLGLIQIEKKFDPALYKNIDMIAATEIPLMVQLGKTQLPLTKVLKLTQGSLIELETNEGDDVDVYANNIKVAEGRIVAVGEYFGIMITKLIRKDIFE